MVSERDLLDLIVKGYLSTDCNKACELKLKTLKKEPQKK